MTGSETRPQTPVSDSPGSLQPLRDTVAFLEQHAPYSDVPSARLHELLSRSHLILLRAGQAIETPSHSPPPHVYVIYQGVINVQMSQSAASPRFQLAPGDTLFASAVYEQRASRARYQADRDSFLLRISADDFLTACQALPSLARYCQQRAGVLLDQLLQQQQQQATHSLSSGDDLSRSLSHFCDRKVLSCHASTSIRDVVQQMHEAGVGSMIISDQGQASGIFTLQDLRRIVATGSVALDKAVAQVMSTPLHCLDHQASSFTAVALMMAHKIRHIPILKDGQLCGIVSERDLFSLQRGSLVELARSQTQASSIKDLAQARGLLQTAVVQMLAHGASASQLTALITQLNDMAIKRCIELITAQSDWPLPVLWLSFGSEGRGEQTLATDQDNGLVMLGDAFSDEKSACLSVAAEINQALDDIGFPLCRGNTMASNPEFCFNLADWRERLISIIQTPTRQHLLEASVLFDARVSVGDAQAWHLLMQDVLDQAANSARFMKALAEHALEWSAGLNVLGQLRGQKLDGQRLMDIKKSAIQPMVAAVRVLAIQNRITASNTVERLQALEQADKIHNKDAEAWREAFGFLQLQRLRLNQQQLATGRPMSNQLDLNRLNPLDKRILKEALRQIERLQTRLKLDYRSA